MSKAIARALTTLKEADLEDVQENETPARKAQREAKNAETEAMFTLAGEAFSLVERIAVALEKRAEPAVLAAGEGLVVGELAKFEPLIDPDLLKRGVDALETLAKRG